MRFILASLLLIMIVDVATAQEREAERSKLYAELELLKVEQRKMNNEAHLNNKRLEALNEVAKLLSVSVDDLDQEVLIHKFEEIREVLRDISEVRLRNLMITDRVFEVLRKQDELGSPN